MAKKIILEDSQGNKLYPKTLGECVTTESGETVEGLVSKSQMFSPIIETDSSMSKVGVGTDIDVSLNVKDGAYEECVFEGRSLVNLFSRVSHAVGIWGREDSSSSLLKPNTRYTVSIQKLPPNCQWTLTIDVNGVSTMMFPYLNSSNKIAFDTLENVGTVMMIHLNDGGTTEITKDMIDEMKPMVIEGDYTNVDIPYFEGIGYAKMPILRNVGKNLFDINHPYDHAYSLPEKYFVENNKLHFINAGIHKNLCWWVKVNKGERIYCSCLEENIKGTMDVRFFPEKRVDNDFTNRNIWRCDNAIKSTICSDEWMLFMLNTADDTGDFVFANINVSYHDTTYEDHKTNILHTSEEIVLRSLPNGVKDTYNALTGEYVKRIGETMLNGSENWTTRIGATKYAYTITDIFDGNGVNGISSHFKFIAKGSASTQNEECITSAGTNKALSLFTNREDLSTVEQLKTWLTQNPVTVQYELAEPIITTVKPSTIPFAYANGHVILESGSSEQSLLPHLKYSVVTGRTGQVTQNAKVLRQQENQITSLEDLLLTQIVQMEYERTLLQFDYELQMMMLG